MIAGKRKQVAYNHGNPLASLNDALRDLMLFAGNAVFIDQHLGAVDNTIDRVVDLVGDTGRQFTD